MIHITDKTKCSGCTACASICPKQCISMEADFEGFLYPVVNTDICVDCGLCNQVCPIENPIKVGASLQKSYAVRTQNMQVLKSSTSGGVFTPLAEMVLSRNGVICAAAYDTDFTVKHLFIDGADIWDAEEFKKFRGSKYVQSDVTGCFQKIEKLLREGREVCFIGTPCQVNGLTSFLRKKYENLLTVDLVCHGTPSPKLWQKYLNFQRDKYRAEIKDICFRSKAFGYHSGGYMSIQFSNGKTYLASARVDYMLKSFFKEISSRPVCYQCPFKQRNRCSDLTIYDCWAFAALTGKKDDDRGYTNVLVQTEKGAQALQSMQSSLDIVPVDTDHAIKRNGSMVERSAKPHAQRDTFYKEIDSRTLPEHIQHYIPVSRKDYVVECIKHILYRIHILQFYRNHLRKKKKRKK